MPATGLSVSKPVSVWNKEIKFSYKDFFKGLTKTATSLSTGSWEKAATGSIETLAAIGLSENDCGQNGWLLIQRSLSQAIFQLLGEQANHFPPEEDQKTLEETALMMMLKPLEEVKLSINEAFFQQPSQLAILSIMQTMLNDWLENRGIDSNAATAITARLPSYFIFALNDEWRKNHKQYKCLTELIDTPFTRAEQRELAWQRYYAWLKQQIELPMFDESFGLSQVYVPLRGYYTKKVKHEKGVEEELPFPHHTNEQHHVIMLREHIAAWLDTKNPKDALRVISGGPGSGKSSFAKVFAAECCEDNHRHVLFIPLHHIELGGDLLEAVAQYVRHEPMLELEENPLDLDALKEKPLLIIFDGLDELSSKGCVGEETAREFIRQVEMQLSRYNQSGTTRLQVIITGREVSIQNNSATLHRPDEVVQVLPYFIPEDERGEHRYHDQHNLLIEDQRQQWWKNYGIASGGDYTNLPEELSSESLEEITAQPLLNYLVALSYSNGNIDFKHEDNLNRVYQDLLTQVYKRGWEQRRHATLQGIEEDDFYRILEEVAVAAWHGTAEGQGRTTTVAEIAKHCKHAHLGALLEAFQDGAKQGVTRLLTAFYFRQFGERPDGEQTFEFTHKSFAEYLMARRIVGKLGDIHEEFIRHQNKPGTGWSAEEALKQWAMLCGPTAIDEYLLSFLHNELLICDKTLLIEWQKTISQLIEYLLRHGMPMEQLGLGNYNEMRRQSCNAELALFSSLNGCAIATETDSVIDWPSTNSLNQWIHRLMGEGEMIGAIFTECINRIHLKGTELVNQGLTRMQFNNADLTSNFLYLNNLSSSDFTGSKLDSAFMIYSLFIKSNFTGASLTRANLIGANLKDTNFTSANLRKTDLGDANLTRSNLTGANLTGANLTGANLTGANLTRANLNGIALYGANLTGVIGLTDGKLEELILLSKKLNDEYYDEPVDE